MVMQTHKIFAYGSLMHKNSRQQTDPMVKNPRPCLLKGYKRLFNIPSVTRFDEERKCPVCVLNLEQGTNSDIINGICFDVSGKNLDVLKAREKQYEMKKIRVRDYINSSVQYDCQVFIAENTEKYYYLLNSRAQAHYLKLCVNGCLEYGEEFLTLFKQTTIFENITDEILKNKIWG